MLASPGNEEAHRSSMKTICNWVGSNASGAQVKNWENSCGEMFLKDTCWHLSAGCSQVHRLLQRGWIAPHSAVCKELFSSPGIICGSVWWGIYSFWHGGEKWEHLKGLICHSLSWEGKKMYYHRGHWPWSTRAWVIVHRFHASLRFTAKAGALVNEAHLHHKSIPSHNDAAMFRLWHTAHRTSGRDTPSGLGDGTMRSMNIAECKLATLQNKLYTSHLIYSHFWFHGRSNLQ